jgi:hypothetical protein
LFRWFLALEMDEASFDHSTFSRNRARLLEHEVLALEALERCPSLDQRGVDREVLVRQQFEPARLLDPGAEELARHAGPSQPPDDPGNPTVNFRGERRSNATHQSTTDPEARLARKGAGKEAKLCYSANALMENRNTLLLDLQVEPADGTAERRAAIAMADERLSGGRRITLGGDKGYDPRDFVAACRALRITPHLAQNLARPGGSALDARTVRHPGYALSQWVRKQVEEAFGWMKTVGGLRQTRYRGRARVQMHAYLVAAAYNLIRIAKLSGLLHELEAESAAWRSSRANSHRPQALNQA